jgi:uncharacterized protein (DUF1697 family)
MQYIALLRGINVGGNNKVSMADLRESFEKAGFTNVSTYINSGNIFFDSSEKSETKLVNTCEAVIEKQFGFHVICAVISATEIKDSLAHAPKWWDDDSGDKHNALFVIAPKTAKEIMDEVGEAKPEYEKIASHGRIIFWTAPLKTFGRTRYSKIVGTSAYQFITIRNSRTTRKLVELSDLL